MGIVLPLGRMTTADKLCALEKIWDDLRRASREIPSPAWHADVLRAREQRVRAGKSQFHDWTEAKTSIRKRAR
jgi:hypothetical protein